MPRTTPLVAALTLALALPLVPLANGDVEEWKGAPGANALHRMLDTFLEEHLHTP